MIGIWHRAGVAAFTGIIEPFTWDRLAALFRERVLPNCDIWVGTADGEVVAFIALNDLAQFAERIRAVAPRMDDRVLSNAIGASIDRLYVAPEHWRQGWGSRLVELAKELSPGGLTLFAGVEPRAAGALYEKHGFKPVEFFTSDPPESARYVTYEWRPSIS
ncbi:MAG: GNAT family N-acetyltransferase [Vicinamibacterales bacterium]